MPKELCFVKVSIAKTSMINNGKILNDSWEYDQILKKLCMLNNLKYLDFNQYLAKENCKLI